MIAEITVAVALALVIARVVTRIGGVVLRRAWDPIAFAYLSALPDKTHIPNKFFLVAELVTGERWDEA